MRHEPKLGEFGFAGDDHVVPFEVGPLDVRGRTVQLGPMLDQILERHDYPEPVARLLAEVCVLTVLLGTALKFDGKFILQTRSDGPVDMLVADFTTPRSLRAYARFDAERLAEAVASGNDRPEQLLGDGVLALTIDQGAYTQRYQGIVQLDGASLEDVARVYFRQSEQIPTDVRLSVAKQLMPGGDGVKEHWRAGGILAQFLPAAPERLAPARSAGRRWRRRGRQPTMIRPTIPGRNCWRCWRPSSRPSWSTRASAPNGCSIACSTSTACGCSKASRSPTIVPARDEKIRGILGGFSAEEIEDSTEGGRIKVSCEFCSKAYEFDPAEFATAN